MGEALLIAETLLKYYKPIEENEKEVRAETIDKFAEKVSQAIVDNTYPYFDKDGKPVNIWKAVLGFEKIEEIAKEIKDGKV